MNKELEHKLHEAGWKGRIGLFSDDLFYPTLSELIEACGDRFRGLTRWEKGEWGATSEAIKNNYMKGEGSTPEEAVANLWLELNKK